MNEELNLPRGKLAAQVAHASVAALLSASGDVQQKWFSAGMPKIVLAVLNIEEIMQYHEKADGAALPTRIIRDAGKTVVEAGTITCLGIGPAPAADIDLITSHLQLVN